MEIHARNLKLIVTPAEVQAMIENEMIDDIGDLLTTVVMLDMDYEDEDIGEDIDIDEEEARAQFEQVLKAALIKAAEECSDENVKFVFGGTIDDDFYDDDEDFDDDDDNNYEEVIDKQSNKIEKLYRNLFGESTES